MFEQDTYESLAELYIYLNDSTSSQLYCLCSRTILRPDFPDEEKQENPELIAVEESISAIRFLNSSTESQPSTVQPFKKKETDEGVSCYCSHYSTDDSFKDAPHSDSGADLSETSRDPGWEHFWAKHGEGIIWKSWIEKYGEYVDPSYTRERSHSSSVTFEGLPETARDSSDLTRLSFGSEVSDSFTNVTALTLSELSTEDSSLLSSSDSAGSSTNDAALWQALWSDHYQLHYQLAYLDYLAGVGLPVEGEASDLTAAPRLDELREAEPDEEEECEPPSEEESHPTLIEAPCHQQTQGPAYKWRPRKRNLKVSGSVGHILETLRSMKMSSDDVATNSNDPTSTPDNPLDEQEERKDNHLESNHNYETGDLPEEKPACEPTDISKSHDGRAGIKRPHEREDDKLRGAFNLIGLAYHGEGVSGGSVIYKKRNIRWQNRMLNMNVHVHFDEDGQILNKDKRTDKKEKGNQWRIANTSEIKSDFSEKDDSSEVEQLSASEESESKKEKRKRKRRRKGLPKEIAENDKLLKYWYQRYRLFSKFDDGIKLDEESWYSVTPEKVSKHTAERCRCDLIVDAFCGAGGNAIQFAFTCERVIAIDIDPVKIELAKHNSRIYGVEDRIEFIVGDFLNLAPRLRADVVFLSPPWGGMGYASRHSYSLDDILPPLGGLRLYQAASAISPNIAYYLPRNINSDDLLRLAGPEGNLELEQNFLGKKLIAVTSYFGELVGPYSQDAM